MCVGANLGCQQLRFSTRRNIDTESDERIALLADGDAFGPDSIPGILDALRPFGTTPVRHIYCREDLAGKWAAQLKKFQVNAVSVPRLRGGKRESTQAPETKTQ